MKILLANKNPIISKLVNLSAQKIKYECEELDSLETLPEANVCIVDNEMQPDLEALKASYPKIIYLAQKGEVLLGDDDILVIHKPFLPTDLIKLINQSSSHQAQILDEAGQDENANAEVKAQDEEYKLDDFDLDFSNLDAVLDKEEQGADEPKQEPQPETQTPKVQEPEDFGDEPDEKPQTKGEELNEQDGNFSENDLDKIFKMSENEKAVSVDEELDASKEAENEGDVGDFMDFAKDMENKFDDINLPDDVPNLEKEKEIEFKEPVVEEKLEEFDTDKSEADEAKSQELFDETKAALNEAKDEALQEIELPSQELSNEAELGNSSENSQLELPSKTQEAEFSNEAEIQTQESEQEPLLQEETEPQIQSEDEPLIEDLATQSEEKTSLQEPLLTDDEPSLLDDELAGFSVEQKEEKMSFDDLPQDAKFLGDEEEDLSTEEALPQLVEEESTPATSSTHDNIKEQLKEIDEMDKEQILTSDIDALDEYDVKIALGEAVQKKEKKNPAPSAENVVQETAQASNTQIIDELSKSISAAVTSSINDETLKAALKGMNMNIQISINFKDNE